MSKQERLLVYAGGPVDYAHREVTHQWRHDLAKLPGIEVYCPICANRDKPDIDVVAQRNEMALLAADRAVFLLDGRFTVGTPVEIHVRLSHRPANSVCIVHTAAGVPGVFVRLWQRTGVLVVESMAGAEQWLAGRLDGGTVSW